MSKRKKLVRIKKVDLTICSVEGCTEWAIAKTGVLVPLCPTHLALKREENKKKHPTLFREENECTK